MSVSSITRQSLISSLGYLDPNQTQDVSDSSSLASIESGTDSSQSNQGSSGTSATGISQVGYILSDLSKLEKQDPAGFKTQAAAVAKDFHDAASQSTDVLQSYGLESMAAQFSNASITGSMSSINLATTANTLVKSYTSQSSLSLLDYLNGNQGSGV